MSSIYNKFKNDAVKRFLALDKYKIITEDLYKCDVSTNTDYQTAFNSFFRVRREDGWRKIFYSYFQKVKNKKDLKFEDILWHLYKETGNIEASFSSKMLATINHDMPIWDKFIVKKYEIKVSGKKEERVKDTIKKYYDILEKEKEELENEEMKEAIKEFKKDFGEYNLSKIKILDYILWNNRDDE